MPDKKISAGKPVRGLTKEVFWGGFKIIAKHLAPHKREVLALVVFSLISALAEAFVPYLAGKVFDAIIKVAREPVAAIRTAGIVVALWFALRAVTDLADWRISSGESQMEIELHNEYIAAGFGRFLLMPMSFHKTRKHGEIGERIDRAASWLSNIVGNVLIRLAPRFSSVVIAIIITFFINVYLALILLIAVVLYSVILLGSVGELAFLQRRMHRAYSKAYGQAYDFLDNVQEIKQATAEDFESRRLKRSFIGVAGRLALNLRLIFRRLDLFQRVIVSLTQLAIFAASIFMVKEKIITPGELVAFNGYAAMLFGPFVILGHNWNVVQNGLTALVQAEKILSSPTETYLPPNAVIVSQIKGEVVFKNVFFGHGGRKMVLKSVSFEVKPGEVVALVGESGVGKTTLIEMILGFHFPQKGRVLVDGHDLRTLDLRSWREKIAAVPQEISLFNDTVAMNIKYGSFGAGEKAVRQAAIEAHADDFIQAFPKKYRQIVGWRGVKLSAGQKQRIAIARALLRDPRILILDEPTSALDAKSEAIIKESLEKLMKGRTTFIIAHRLSTVQKADKIIVLDKGTIAETGTHEELLARGGIYRRLYELQFSGKR